MIEKSEQTPAASTVHHPLGQQGLWHTPSKKVPVKQQLPAYLRSKYCASIDAGPRDARVPGYRDCHSGYQVMGGRSSVRRESQSHRRSKGRCSERLEGMGKAKRVSSLRHKNKRDKRLLLSNLAQVLNACDKAGLEVKLKHGIVFTNQGYVLPIDDRWAARSLKKFK